MTTEAALHLDRVVAERAGDGAPTRVVDDLTLWVNAGELVALMGPSGSGKTSVIHLCCGLLAPMSGSVALLGRALGPGDQRAWVAARRRQLGVVHQRLDLLGGLSVLDNVALPLLLDGTGVRASQQAARRALARVGAGDLASLRPAELSGGQQQRAAIARAIVGPRLVVLADEPTASLDSRAADQVAELLAQLAAGGAAVLLATHDARVASWADRVVYLRDNGREAAELTTEILPGRPS